MPDDMGIREGQEKWEPAMYDYFGADAPPLESQERMNKAIEELFWNRVGLGLEFAIEYRRQLAIAYIDPSTYMMCSTNT